MWDDLLAGPVYIDSNIVILAIEAGNRWTPMLRALFERIDRGDIQGFTSEITLAEVLAKPYELDATDVVGQFEALLAENSPLASVPVDRTVLRLAARLRASLGVKLVDGIHVATALGQGCSHFLSNDVRLGRKLVEPRWVTLGEVEASG